LLGRKLGLNGFRVGVVYGYRLQFESVFFSQSTRA